MTEKEIIDAVKSNELSGLVECDISVPPHLKAHFAEMTPIFKNIKISLDDVGETMRQFVRENKLISQPCQSLIRSYVGEKVLLITPLLKWYMNHGLIVSRVYQVVEYEPKACFK